MNPDFIAQVARVAIDVTLFLSLPILGVGLVVGLFISLFQAVTQIQEMTLVFVPKIVAVLLCLMLLSPWMMRKIMFFTEQIILNIPMYAR